MDWKWILLDCFLGLGCGLLALVPRLIRDAKKERTEFDFNKQVQCIVGMLVVFAILLESQKFIENIYLKNVRVILIMVFVMQLVYRGGWCYDYYKTYGIDETNEESRKDKGDEAIEENDKLQNL